MIRRVLLALLLMAGVAHAQRIQDLPAATSVNPNDVFVFSRPGVPNQTFRATASQILYNTGAGNVSVNGVTKTLSEWLASFLLQVGVSQATLNTTYAGGGLTNGLLFGVGNQISYCALLVCQQIPTTDHMRASSLFWSTTNVDNAVEENTVGIETAIGTGYYKSWAPNTGYNINDNIVSPAANGVYRATTAGVSAGSGTGPSGTEPAIQDGTIVWKWISVPTLAAKVGLYNEARVNAGAGNTWAQANNTWLEPGDVPAFNINTEFDMTNNAAACVPGVANCNDVEVNINGSQESTTAMHITTTNTTTYAALWGIRLNAPFLAQRADIEDDSSGAIGLSFDQVGTGAVHSTASIYEATNSPISYFIGGNHAVGSIVDQSNGPVSLLITGTHSAESISDTSNAPTALAASGNYGLAAITTLGANTGISLLARAGQSVCLNNIRNCITYSPQYDRFYFSNATGGIVASLDGSGNFRVSGSVISGTTP